MSSEYSVEVFLAREQEQLAGIDDEFGALTTADPVPQIPQNGSFDRSINEQVVDMNMDKMATPTIAVGQNGFEQPHHEFLNGSPRLESMMDEEVAANAIPNTLSALPLHQQQVMRQMTTPTPPPMREEPAKITIWREQQRERLEKKDLNEEMEKEKLREQAKRELDEWYKNHNDQLQKTKQRNHAGEQEVMAQGEEVQPGQEWERVAGMVDFNPKSARSTKDLSRFRSILLQMKNQSQKSSK